ncbi:MAG: PCYCGC motif-containing (lipo)protein [Candidatus Hodarchaeota archaeon]
MVTNFGKYHRIRYPTKTQVEIWFLKRNDISGRKIAKQKDVTPAFISKTLKIANKRIKSLLENTAKANKISLNLISAELGFAKGKSHIFNLAAYITFSPENGVQVWYDHKGDCATCEEFTHCRTVLLQEFKERNIKLDNTQLRPTDLGDYLFQKLEDMVK